MRIACAAVVIICTALAIDAALSGADATTALLAVGQVLIWGCLGIVYGVLSPSKVDAWEVRHGLRERRADSSPPHGVGPTPPGVHTP